MAGLVTREAIILAGGRGTRLKGVVSDRPKPMAPVRGRPFVEWLLLMLRSQGVERVVFSTGHLGQMIEDHFGNGARWGVEIGYAREPLPLGTAGAVRFAAAEAGSEPLLILNGDSYCQVDVHHLLTVHAEASARATLWLVQASDVRRYGSVEVGEQGAVRAFHEKPAEPRAGLINAGIYLLQREVVAAIPEGRPVSMEGEVLPGLVGRGLYAATGRGPFLDIGTPEAYAAADAFFLERVLKWHSDAS